MNQTQWQVLNAMGISTWQRLEPGELAPPKTLHPQEASKDTELYVVVVEQEDLVRQRELFQSILKAVNWPLSSIRLLHSAQELSLLKPETFKLIWWLGGEPDVELEPVSQIGSASLEALAATPSQKSALWQELKAYRHV